jgi:hypothetical protein
MTRGLAALGHGDVLGALALNPGVLLAIVAVAIGVVAVWRRARVPIPLWSPWAVVGALWSFQLVKFATGRPL